MASNGVNEGTHTLAAWTQPWGDLLQQSAPSLSPATCYSLFVSFFLVIPVAEREITGREKCRHESRLESEVGCVDHFGSTVSVT